MLRTPADEAKMIDEHLTYIHEILDKRTRKRGDFDNEAMRIADIKKRKEFDKTRIEQQMRKFLSSKRYAHEKLRNLDRDLRRISEEEAIALENLDQVDATIKLYERLAKRFELTSPYRKRLNKIVDTHREYQTKLAEIVAPKRYYEKSADLTESEQLKIIFKILTEQEDGLTRDVIFKDILDMAHFKDYIKSVVCSFKTPSVMGYKPTYKTDYIWVTITTPPNMWTEDMSQEVYTALAGYVTSEVSRTVTVRVVESRNPWTTRVLVVGGRGKAEDMEAFDEMQNLYSKSNDFERYLSRSFLLEHSVYATSIIQEINQNNNGHPPPINNSNINNPKE